MISGRAIRSHETPLPPRGSTLSDGASGTVWRPCAHPGCRELVEAGRCGKHKGASDAARGGATERLYDAVWQRFRHWFLTRYPLCADCEERGVVEAAREVHHRLKVKDHPELRLIESNCRGLCSPCHSVRTRRGE